MAFGSQRLHLFLLFLLFPIISSILASAQSVCPIPLGSDISAGGNTAPWRSPSLEFAFGFRPLLQSSSSDQTDQFLLSIWYDKIPEQTIVWSLNFTLDKGSKIQLTREGNFVLIDHRGQEKWTPNTKNQVSDCAAMRDSGNFVLLGKDSGSIWESFDEPTNTMLPGQRIGMGGNLTSRVSETDYTGGRFQLRMQPDGNLVLYTIFVPTEVVNSPYWASGTLLANADSKLVFGEAGYIYIANGSKTVSNVTEVDSRSRQDFYYMARIDIDGVFRLYKHPKANYAADAAKSCISSWSVVRMIPEDICNRVIAHLGSGACGYNSYCENVDGRPKCLCPDGFSPSNQLDPRGGCKPDFPVPSCQQNGWESNFNSVEFKELKNTDWPFNDYEVQPGVDVDKERCKEFCLKDCFCAAAIYKNGSCFKKRFPLSNGRKHKSLNLVALIKVPKNNSDPEGSYPESKERSTLVIIISVLLGSSIFLNFLLLAVISVAILFMYRKNLMNLLSASSVYGVRRYTFKELEEATGGFKQQLGRGSFGTVYKGVLVSVPKRYIAVKRLDNLEKEGEKEFMTEVSAIGRTHHKNLVTLLGYCDEGSHRLLVYEYMSNGSLASILFGLSRPHWNQRMQIAFGIARGLTYLHEECSTQIIHCDVKPQNILIDEYLVPKISDFGLAKLLLSEQSKAARTHIRGTVGYFAPEWFRKASITVKVDVYSFGVMLLEIICCTSSVVFGMADREDDAALVDWVYDCYNKRKLDKLVENDEEARNDMKGVERLVMVGIWCIQEDPSLRPSMRRVTQMLEGVAEVSVPPRPSVFSSR